MSDSGANRLGLYLRDCRTRLDPAALGFGGRRRTRGLRREEVAQRSNISTTWYTWLEQGRGGAPSADVLERIAAGLMLTEAEREHLFMLGLGHPPVARYKGSPSVTPRLQRVLDALETSPALIKTATWDVVAWNRAAAIVLTDYGALAPPDRNILRLMFCDPRARAVQHDFDSIARVVVGAFRADVARAGADSEVGQLVAEISARSPDFRRFWAENDVPSRVEGVKELRHPALGTIALEFSSFAVDGRPDLAMMVYNPRDEETAARIRAMVVVGREGSLRRDP